MSKFELSLDAGYVPDWTIVDAVRELFQNALDQQITSPDNTMFFSYDVDSQQLMVGNKKSVLQTRSLLLGSSSKRDNPDTIGEKGEGYKIAGLVLSRVGKKLTIYNYGAREVWTFRLVDSRKYGVPVLTVDVNKKFFWEKVPQNDLIMAIDGITEGEYKDIIESNLHLQDVGDVLNTSYGRILLDPKYENKVFVNGLFVCNVVKYGYGYDLKPRFIKLDRDRKAVGDWDLSYRTASMWTETKDPRINDLAVKGMRDVEKINYHLPAANINSYATQAAVSFKQEHGPKAVPVTNQDQANAAKREGKKPVVVTEPYKNIIDSAVTDTPSGRKRKEKPKPTLYSRLKAWYNKSRHQLNPDAQAHFREILKIVKESEEK